MTVTIDPTNVPAVLSDTLWSPMRHLVNHGRGLMLLRGIEACDMQTLTGHLWGNSSVTPAERSTVLLRIIALAQAFAFPVLRRGLMQHGYAYLDAAVAVSAAMHLNAKRGFNPRTLAWRVTAELQRRDDDLKSRRMVRGNAALAA